MKKFEPNNIKPFEEFKANIGAEDLCNGLQIHVSYGIYLAFRITDMIGQRVENQLITLDNIQKELLQAIMGGVHTLCTTFVAEGVQAFLQHSPDNLETDLSEDEEAHLEELHKEGLNEAQISLQEAKDDFKATMTALLNLYNLVWESLDISDQNHGLNLDSFIEIEESQNQLSYPPSKGFVTA